MYPLIVMGVMIVAAIVALVFVRPRPIVIRREGGTEGLYIWRCTILAQAFTHLRGTIAGDGAFVPCDYDASPKSWTDVPGAETPRKVIYLGGPATQKLRFSFATDTASPQIEWRTAGLPGISMVVTSTCDASGRWTHRDGGRPIVRTRRR